MDSNTPRNKGGRPRKQITPPKVTEIPDIELRIKGMKSIEDKLKPFEAQAIEQLMVKIINGDKDMLKLYFQYLYGSPKVRTENETRVAITGIDIKRLISFEDDDVIDITPDDSNDDDYFDDI